jgi:type IV secretory pathway TrbF-like protein
MIKDRQAYEYSADRADRQINKYTDNTEPLYGEQPFQELNKADRNIKRFLSK